MINSRTEALSQWLKTQFSNGSIELVPLSGDAGFRHYYRFHHNNSAYIAVDAAPETSNNHGFVAVAKALASQNIPVPDIIACDLNQGFVCISDLGNTLFADVISPENSLDKYQQAINLLPAIATTTVANDCQLPVYDRDFIGFELSIFTEWLVDKHLSIALNAEQEQKLLACFDFLINSALSQPQVFMHRDYHSRNIMCLADSAQSLAVIDFQDAVQGPITYDVVSLLRDCYFRLPDEQIKQLFAYYCQKMTVDLSLPEISAKTWLEWFDLMGLQRHLKASGIFARLYHRDDKPGYLKDIPLTLSYIVQVSKNYPELAFLHQFIVKQVQPAMAQRSKPSSDLASMS